MMGRVFGIAGATILFALLFYASRFWVFRWWERPGLFGWGELPPQGALVRRWLRGTEFAQFELLFWAIGAFLLLSVVQALVNRLSSKGS